MKTDDDAFVRIDEVLSSLRGKAPDGLLYGHISFESSPHRDRDNKWYISPEVLLIIYHVICFKLCLEMVTIAILLLLSLDLFYRNGHIHPIPLGHMVQVI